jgi:hypothetical protein
MARVVSEPRLLPWPKAAVGRIERVLDRRTWRSALWNCLKRQALQVRLPPGLRPQSRLELALCEAFRCQPSWSTEALVERLSLAPGGSELVSTALENYAAPPLGRTAAWAILRRWLDEGRLLDGGAATPSA